MNDKQEQLEFDEIELHSDINVHHHQPEQKRPKPNRREKVERTAPSKLPLLFMFVLFLGAAGAAGFFFNEHRKLLADFEQLSLREEVTSSHLEEASSTLANTSGTLEKTKDNFKQLKEDLRKAEADNKKLRAEQKDLHATIKSRDKAVSTHQEDLAKAKRELKSANGKLANAKSQTNRIRKELDQLKATSNEQIVALEQRLEMQQSDHQVAQTSWQSREKSIESKLNAMTREKDRLERTLEEESDASRKIFQETSTLRNSNSELRSQVRNMEQELKNKTEKLQKLQTVNFGDLVPFTDQLTAAKVSYREPMPEGVKIPKKLGHVVVQALITEVGSVEKAYILPGQQLEASLSAGVVRSVYKWKFTPPSLQGVRVRTWQPIMITPE